MDIRYTRVWVRQWSWYGCLVEAGTPVRIHTGMMPPCSARFSFVRSSAARCCCPPRCWLTVAHARVLVLLVHTRLRCWLPVAVCLTAARAPMIADPFLTERLPVCQCVDIFLMLACIWERGCGRLDINQEIVVVSAFMSVHLWELS